jgi:hypothetical protein
VGLNLYLYAGNDPVNGVYGGANYEEDSDKTGNIVRANVGNVKKQNSMPQLSWLAEHSTTIIGVLSSLHNGLPILWHYHKYASIINSEFKLYGISKWNTSLQLSNVNFKIGVLDGLLIGANVLLDMYDSYQRGVSTEGILLGGALTAASGVGMLFLNKGIMWAATTIGTAICPGFGTAIGFTVGLIGTVLVDIFLGDWITTLIDENIR